MNFEYQNPTKIIFGKDTINKLKISEKNILLVYGKGSIKKNEVYEKVKNNFKNHNIIELNNVKPNPDLDKVNEGIKLCKENNIEAILAVGGGSVIDTGKAIAAGYFVDDVWNLFERKEEIKKALPIYTILTISATGSEMNGNCVITNEKENKKWAIKNILLNPKITIIDPTIQKTLPSIQTANGAMDTLSHIMEFYFTFETEETMITLNESLMKSTIKATDILLNNPEDYNARENLAWSATLALNGVCGTMGNGGEWQCHLIEHGLSGFKKDLAHGSGLAIVYPAWIKYVHDNKAIFKRWSKEIWNKDNIEEGIIEMKNKLKSWNLPVSLNEVEIYERDIDEIVNIIIKSPPRNSYIKNLDKEDYKKILISCLK